MVNWYDIEVEQKIAQERYQTIVRSRQDAQAREASSAFEDLAGQVANGRNWLGDQLIVLGCRLKPVCS